MSIFGGGFFGGGSSSGGIFGGGTSSGGIIRSPLDEEKILRKIIKENDDGLLGELYRIVDDTKEEFTELMTEGFVEMVIKGNSDYKTSFEIRDEADKIVAKQVERYKDKCKELNKVLSKLNDHITSLYEKKVKLAELVNVQVGKKQGVSNNINYKSWMKPTYISTQSNMTRLCDMIGVNSFSSQMDRKNRANEYLEDARDYEVYVSGKIAEMNYIKANANAIEQFLQEEDKMLEALEKSMNMHRKLEYNKIARQLENLIVQYVLNDSGEKNESYLVALNQLDNLCRDV